MSAEIDAAPVSAARRRAVLAGCMLGLSVASLDQMILSSAAPAISAELGGLARTPWLFTAYLLTTACTMPLWGHLGDLFGRRPVFQAAILIFVGAALLAGNSHTMGELVLARALQGIGGGGLLTLPNAIIADVVSVRMRAAYYAFGSGVWAISSLVGPLVGGLLVDGPGWRYIFYSYLPLGLAGIALFSVAYRIQESRVAHRIDLLGALLLAASIGSLLLLCSGAGLEFPLWSLPAAGLGAAFLAGLAAFALHERRASEPLLPLELLRLPAVPAALVTSFFFGLGNFGIGVFIPLFAITVNGASATGAGMRLMPVTVGMFFASMAVGRRIAATGRFRHFPPIGLVAFATGVSLYATLERDSSTALALAFSFLAGIGSGMINPVVTFALQHTVPRESLGLATALPAFFRSIGQSVGTALLGAVLVARLDLHLLALAPGSGLRAESLRASPAEIHALGEPLESAVIEAFREALADVFLTMALFFGLALLAALRLRDPEPEATARS